MTLPKKAKLLFYITLFLLPINLGKHFVVKDSYVLGLLVDYLIPTMFFQDLLVFIIDVIWLYEAVKSKYYLKLMQFTDIQLGIFFIFTVFLSTLVSESFVISFTSWLRLLLYFLLFVFCRILILEKETFTEFLYRTMCFLLTVSLFFVSVLGILQFANQGAFFNNYLFFGEQPYTFSTLNIAKENVLGISKVPAYGLFRHPNVFGGYLAVLLILVFDCFYKKIFPKKPLIIVFIVGVLALVLTFSFTSWAAFLLGLGFYFLYTKGHVHFKKLLIGVSIIFLVSGFLFPHLDLANAFSDNPSYYRRVLLIEKSYQNLKSPSLFGEGFGTSVLTSEKFNFNYDRDIRFLQPVHNIFLLLFVESGIIALILFLTLVFKNLHSTGSIFVIALMQLILLGSFDHYIFTIHQTLLLFWIILAFTDLKTHTV